MQERRVTANDVEFSYLEAGAGRRTPRPLPSRLPRHGPHLAAPAAGAGRRRLPRRGPVDAGLRAHPDPGGRALSRRARWLADACALHEALGGDDRAVLIGHDWGAAAAYGAAVLEPGRWSRVVTMAVPPFAAVADSFFSFAQLKRSFYIFVFQTPLAETAVSCDNHAFIDGLWADWSPGYDAAWDVARVKEAIGTSENLSAAIGYYRAMFDPSLHGAGLRRGPGGHGRHAAPADPVPPRDRRRSVWPWTPSATSCRFCRRARNRSPSPRPATSSTSSNPAW